MEEPGYGVDGPLHRGADAVPHAAQRLAELREELADALGHVARHLGGHLERGAHGIPHGGHRVAELLAVVPQQHHGGDDGRYGRYHGVRGYEPQRAGAQLADHLEGRSDFRHGVHDGADRRQHGAYGGRYRGDRQHGGLAALADAGEPLGERLDDARHVGGDVEQWLAKRLDGALQLAHGLLRFHGEAVGGGLLGLLRSAHHVAEAVLHARQGLDHAHGIVLAQRGPQGGGQRGLVVLVWHLREVAQHRLQHVLGGGAAVLEVLEDLLRALAERADGFLHAAVGQRRQELVEVVAHLVQVVRAVGRARFEQREVLAGAHSRLAPSHGVFAQVVAQLVGVVQAALHARRQQVAGLGGGQPEALHEGVGAAYGLVHVCAEGVRQHECVGGDGLQVLVGHVAKGGLALDQRIVDLVQGLAPATLVYALAYAAETLGLLAGHAERGGYAGVGLLVVAGHAEYGLAGGHHGRGQRHRGGRAGLLERGRQLCGLLVALGYVLPGDALEVALQGLDVLGYVNGVEHRFDDDVAVHAHLVALLSAANTSRIAASLPSSEPCELRPLPSSNALWAAFQASTSCLLYLVGFGLVAGLR